MHDSVCVSIGILPLLVCHPTTVVKLLHTLAVVHIQGRARMITMESVTECHGVGVPCRPCKPLISHWAMHGH